MTEREKVMQDMERVAFPIYKPNSKDIMVLGALYDADYRKADEVEKETLQKLFTAVRNSSGLVDYREFTVDPEMLAVDLDDLREIIKQEFGVEVEE